MTKKKFIEKYNNYTIPELRNMVFDLEVKGAWTMSKEELIQTLYNFKSKDMDKDMDKDKKVKYKRKKLKINIEKEPSVEQNKINEFLFPQKPDEETESVISDRDNVIINILQQIEGVDKPLPVLSLVNKTIEKIKGYKMSKKIKTNRINYFATQNS